MHLLFAVNALGCHIEKNPFSVPSFLTSSFKKGSDMRRCNKILQLLFWGWGGLNCVQEAFLKSSHPQAACDMRCHLQQWDKVQSQDCILAVFAVMITWAVVVMGSWGVGGRLSCLQQALELAEQLNLPMTEITREYAQQLEMHGDHRLALSHYEKYLKSNVSKQTNRYLAEVYPRKFLSFLLSFQ
jgi:hypothetical protein